ncbi:YndJ family transporter [Streptomyces sp. NPDC046161]|uniref:YndJ family transporter n=1 Tax=Streptomyces sp. NPDC046161 TaxID=3155132 RepID=UPI0033E6EA3B
MELGVGVLLLWLLLNVASPLSLLWTARVALCLIDPGRPDRTARFWPLLAAPGALSLFLPRGVLATALAALYATATLTLAARVPARLLRALPRGSCGRGARPASAEIAVGAALVMPLVTASAMVCERAGLRLFGLDPEDLVLVLWHFQFAQYAAALTAGLAYRAASSGALGRWAAYSVPLGFPLSVLGYLTGLWTGLVGAVVLTGGLWAATVLTRKELRHRGGGLVTGILLAFGALITLGWASAGAPGALALALSLTAAAAALGFLLAVAATCSRLAGDRAEGADRACRMENVT